MVYDVSVYLTVKFGATERMYRCMGERELVIKTATVLLSVL